MQYGIKQQIGSAALIIAGSGTGFLTGTMSPLLTGLCFAGTVAALFTFLRPDLALYLFFSGVIITTDSVPADGSGVLFIPDVDIIKGLPSALTTLFLMIFCVTAARRMLLERRPFPVSLRGPGVYLLILFSALLTGLFKNGDREIMRVDFMNMLFPVLCFYLCIIRLDDYERIRRMLTVLLCAAAVKALFLSAAYLAGRGWTYQLDDSEAYQVVTMDSADLLVFITLVLTALYLLMRGDIRGGKAAVAAAACIPMLFAVVFSYRRAQWVGMIFSLGLLCAGAPKLIRRRIMISLLIVLCAGGSLVVLAGMGRENLARISSRLTSVFDRTQSSNFYHIKESQQVLADLFQSPLPGLGLGGYHSPLGLYENDTVPANVVHNTFLYIWMKTGLAGLLFFIWAAWLYVRLVFRSRRNYPQDARMNLLLPLAASSGLWLAMFLTSPVPWYFHQTGLIALFAAMGVSLARQADRDLEIIQEAPR